MKLYTEQENVYLRKLCWQNVLELFNKKKNMSSKSIIKSQIKLINSYHIIGKNKYKTVKVLQNYFNNPNKELAEQIFWNTIKDKIN